MFAWAVILATDKAKREVFDKLAAHFKVLADELEKAIGKIAPNGSDASTAFGETFLGRKTYEPVPKLDDEA